MPRFVLLEHDWPTLHWDLLLESGGVLRAWRLDSLLGTEPVRAEPNFDHRLIYLDYEGPISGDRGSVIRCDGGELEWLSDQPDEILVRVRGTTWNGTLQLRGGSSWVCQYTPTGDFGANPDTSYLEPGNTESL